MTAKARILLILTLFCVTFSSFSHHFAGAEFTYRCIGTKVDSSTYRIELTLYRDCTNGTPFSAYYTSFYESTGCGQASIPLVLTPSGPEVDITRLCSGDESNCTNSLSPIVGIYKRTYSATVTVARCSDWYFWWRDQSRNALSLSNVVSFPEQDMFVDMTIDNSTHICNSSFTFSDSSLITKFFCVGTPYSYNISAEINNLDGDSLSFHLVPPLNGPGTQIMYEAGFTPSNPISTASGFNLDAGTGVLTFTPTTEEGSVISIEIWEHKNGTIVGKSVRDMQIIVSSCANTPPEILGVNGTSEDTIYMCVNTDQYVFVPTYDPDSGQNATLSVINNNLPGNAQVYDSANTMVIVWEPDTSHAGIYSITFEASDNECPYPQSNQRTIYFIVDTSFNAQCNCSRAKFKSYSDCDTTYFTNLSYSVGGNIISWIWDFDDPGSGTNNTSTLEEPIHIFSTSGLFNVILTWTDDEGCTKTFTKPVVVCGEAQTDITIFRQQWCESPGRVIYQARCDAGPHCTDQGFTWDLHGDTTVIDAYYLYPPEITTKYLVVEYSQPGYHIVSVDITIFPPLSRPEWQSAFCYATHTDTFYIHPKPDLTLHDSSFYQTCNPGYDTFFVASSNYDSLVYQWYLNGDPIPEPEGTNDTLFTSTRDLTLASNNPRDIQYLIEVIDTITGCPNRDSLYVYDPLPPNFYVTPYCAPGDSVIFVDTSKSAMYYDFVIRKWDFGDGSPMPPLDTANHITHFYGSFDTIYYPTLYILDSDDCFDIATFPIVRIALPDSNISLLGGDGNDTICHDERNITFLGPNDKNALIGKWVWIIDDPARVDSIVVILNDSSTSNGDKYLHFHYKNGVAIVDSLRKSQPYFNRTYLASDTGWQHVSVSIRFNYSYDSQGRRYDSLYCSAGPYFDSINIRPPQVVDISGIGECLKDSFHFKAVHIAGDPIATWFWDFNDRFGNTIYNTNDTLVQIATSDTTIASYLYSAYTTPDFGRRNIDLTITDVYGCTTEMSTFKDTAVAMAPQDFMLDRNCSDNAIALTPFSADSNCINCWENISLFQWDFGIMNIDSDTAIQIAYGTPVSYVYDSAGIYNVTLIYSHPAGYHSCKDTVVKQIYVQPTPELDIIQLGAACIGYPTLFLDRTAPLYTFEYDSINEVYTGNTVPSSISSWTFYFENDSITFNSASPDSIYRYIFETPGFHDSILVELTSSNGCVGRQYLDAYVAYKPEAWFYFKEIPVATAPAVFLDSTDWYGENFHPDISHHWTIFDSLQNVLFADSGYGLTSITYPFPLQNFYDMRLITTNQYDCADTVLRPIDTYVYLDFPTAFSPNGTGNRENERFRLHYKGIAELLNYTIFNRYGEVVFEGNGDLEAEWDGTYKGRPQPVGPYICMVRGIDIFGKIHEKKKNVMIVR